jgi:urea ABC transporter ATP-binding protein UrtD
MADLVRTERLTKNFRGLVANDTIDFALGSGEIRCVIGPNGAGKTTFISMISGHLAPSSGTIWFRGRDITRFSVNRRAQAGIARKFQTPTLFDHLTVDENLEIAALGKRGTRPERESRIREVLEVTRLGEFRDRRASALSHGQRQWLEIGMLLTNRAELLLLDEPTAGMTAHETHATVELVHMLAGTRNLSMVIIEHDMNFIRALKAPVTVFHLGRVLVHGTFEEVARNELVRNAYLGHAR